MNNKKSRDVKTQRSIAWAFVISCILGAIMVFFAIAKRTDEVIAQRRELRLEKEAKAQKAQNEQAQPELPQDQQPEASSPAE